MIRKSNELQIGKAGEYLVCADLIIKGFVAFISEQGLPYDVLLDNGKKIYKVQVKTTSDVRVVPQRKMESKMYIFNIGKHGKNNLKRYTASEVDLYALVCLKTRQVGYLLPKDMPETINIRADELRGTYYDEDGIATYRKAAELRNAGLDNRNIALRLGKNESVISRYLQEGFVPFETKARYFSDFIRTKEWFYEL